ncbi:MAG: dipeptidase [Gemmatimonadales bacterium]
MVDRRSFLWSSSAAALGALPASRAVAGMVGGVRQPSDPLARMIVVNALGGLNDGYGSPPPVPPTLGTAEARAAAKASGMSAVNMTVASGPDFEATVAAIGRYNAFVQEHPNDFLKVLSTDDIRRAKAENKVGIIYGFQNAAMLGDKVDRVDTFANLGVRSIQLTYNSLNQLGGGSMAPGDPGLTPFGREAVARLNERRVMVDLSHSGRQICLDAARASKTPIAISHTGCKALVDYPRNKTDEELKLVADRGGFIGIYFVMFVAKGREATVDDVVAHIRHAVNLCGVDQIGIGSDYGIVETKDQAAARAYWGNFVRRRVDAGSAAIGEDPNVLPYARGLTGPEQFRNLFRALEKAGFNSAAIEKILGTNYLRFAKEIWGA